MDIDFIKIVLNLIIENIPIKRKFNYSIYRFVEETHNSSDQDNITWDIFGHE
jgi:hypothetical protein